MGNPTKECQYCTKRHMGCHSGCEVDEKIRERSETIRQNRIKYNSYADYFFQDAQVRMKRGC